MVKKAVNAKAKAALKSCFSTKEMDQNCPRDSWSTNSTVTKSQGSIMKHPQTKKPKVQGTKSLLGPQRFKFSEKTWKEKKKK